MYVWVWPGDCDLRPPSSVDICDFDDNDLGMRHVYGTKSSGYTTLELLCCPCDLCVDKIRPSLQHLKDQTGTNWIMEVTMSLNTVVRLPLSSCSRTNEDVLVKDSLFSTRIAQKSHLRQKGQSLLVVKAKGKKGMAGRQFQRPPQMPSLPKIEDDGNPRFVIFIRMANVYLWYPLSLITGGTTAKIMVAAKDNFLGKYIYKDTLARNLAAVIYRDEKEIQKTAFKQHRALRSATEFRYGYKLVENGNLRAALATSDVIDLPTQDQLKTVLDKVKDFFGDAKESFGKLTSLNATATEETEEAPKEKAKVKG